MTLIIYLRCQNGTIIIADRKQSNVSEASEITKKYYIPDNEEFLFSMSGDADRIDIIVNELKKDQTINSESIRPQLDKIMRESPDFRGDVKISTGLLLIKNNFDFRFHNVRLSNSLSTIIDENPRFRCYGEGSILADYLIRNFKPYNFDCKKALQYLIAIMNDVAERVDSVGSIDGFGFDILYISDSNEIKKETIYEKDNVGKIEHNFEPKDDFELNLFPKENPIMEMLSIEKDFEKKEKISKSDIRQKSYSLSLNSKTHHIRYKIENAIIEKIILDIEASSLIIAINSTNDGILTIELPRKLIDSKEGRADDAFFVLVDGEEMEFKEKTEEVVRILTIQFPEGTEEIEIIGTQHPLVIQTDKSEYPYGSDIIVTIINSYAELGKNNILKIKNEHGKQIYEKIIPINKEAKGIYQEIISIEGKNWESPGSKFKVFVEYEGEIAEVGISRTDFGMFIELDQKVYSWTDKIQIALVAPELNKNPNEVETVGNQPDSTIVIETGKGQLINYELIETGEDTGIFTGEVTLSGFENKELEFKNKPVGITNGKGPIDGKIACLNQDAIVITLSTPSKTISASALIRWNIGEIQWLSAVYPVSGEGTIRVVDPDMSFQPNKKNNFKIKVWSDTNPSGINVLVEETREGSGIFIGKVLFTQSNEDEKLKVSEGDTITAEYIDKTLPEPYSRKEELKITATTMIGTLMPPLEKMICYTPRFFDKYDNELATGSAGGEIRIISSVFNESENEQKFTFLLQMSDIKGKQVFTEHISDVLKDKQGKQIEIKWTPERGGIYKGTIFLWESINIPSSLSSPVDFDLIIEPLEKSIPESPEKIALHSHIFSNKSTIIIPKGSSHPGCEETDSCYIPSEMIVRVNQTVIWRNEDDASHTITSGTPERGSDSVFDSSLILPGSSFAVNFKRKGVFPYYCLVHPWQTGKVIVE